MANRPSISVDVSLDCERTLSIYFASGKVCYVAVSERDGEARIDVISTSSGVLITAPPKDRGRQNRKILT